MKRPASRLAAAALGIGAGVAAVFGVKGVTLAADAPAQPGQRIEVVAKKFEFGPTEIRVKKGQRVTLVLSSPDFVHGFSVPDFNVRADGIPGKTIELTFVADKAGTFIYLCDNFCGEDHDKMTGFLIVTEG
jgi:cytochrome c oxidase subunit II